MSAALSADVLDLLAAIRAALDVPRSAPSDVEEWARDELLNVRTNSARIALNGVLDRDANLAGVTERLTTRTANTPVTYTLWQDPDGGAK